MCYAQESRDSGVPEGINDNREATRNTPVFSLNLSPCHSPSRSPDAVLIIAASARWLKQSRALLLDNILLAFICECPNGVSMAGGSYLPAPTPGKSLPDDCARDPTWHRSSARCRRTRGLHSGLRSVAAVINFGLGEMRSISRSECLNRLTQILQERSDSVMKLNG